MKLISWNVNGFRAVLGKGFADYFAAADADVFCSIGTVSIGSEWYFCVLFAYLFG